MIVHIDDWFDIHEGFDLELTPGYTPLVGPNGAGKSTLLSQLENIFRDNKDFKIFKYSNYFEGGNNAMQKQLGYNFGNINLLAELATSSEGEQIAINFSEQCKLLGQKVAECKSENKNLLILLDALDSGASIDRLREYLNLFKMVFQDCENSNIDCYIIVAVNSYELVKDRTCKDVRTGKDTNFSNYEDYANFICNYKM